MREREWPEQPGPNRALMVASIPIDRRSTIPASVLRVIRREAAKAMRGQQVPRAGIYYGALLFRTQSAFRKRKEGGPSEGPSLTLGITEGEHQRLAGLSDD